MLRSLFVILITICGIILALKDCIFALLLHTWYSYVSPLQLTYGILEDSRLSSLVAVIMIITIAFQRKALIRNDILSWQAILLCMIAFISLAQYGELSLSSIVRSEEFLLKLAVIALISPVAINTTAKLKLYVLTIVISAGIMASYYGTFGLGAGSKNIAGAGRIGDNNAYALLLTSLLPLIFLQLRTYKNVLVKVAFLLMSAAVMLALVLTNSRGGFIGFVTVLFLLIFTIPKKLYLPSLSILLIFTYLTYQSGYLRGINEYSFKRDFESNILSEALDSYQARILTLREAEDTESGQSRLHFWHVALLMANDNPWFGVGFGNFLTKFDEYDFSGGQYGKARSVHSTIMLVLAELGWSGLILFLSILLSIYFKIFTIRRELREVKSPDALYIRNLLTAIGISLFGFFIAGLFVIGLMQEIFWSIVTIVISVSWLYHKNLIIPEIPPSTGRTTQ